MRTGTVLKVIAALVVAVVIGGVAVISSIDVSQYRGLIEAEAEQATGRKLTITGDLDMSLGLTPAVVVNGVRFANAPWASQSDMMTVERFEAEVALIPALTGDIQVQRLVLIKPVIHLESGKDGKGNWEFATVPDVAGSSLSSSNPAEVPRLPSLRGVSVVDGRMTYTDAASGKTTTVELDDFSAEADGFADPLQIVLKGAVNGLPVEMQGVIGPLPDLTGDELYPVALKGSAHGVHFDIDGTVAQPLAGAGLDLAVVTSADDLSGLPHLKLSGRLTGGGSAYYLAGLDLSLGASRATGTASVDLSRDDPAVNAALQFAVLDLQELAPADEETQSSGAASKPKPDKVLPRETLPLDVLLLADAEFDVGVAKLVLPDDVVLEGLSAKGNLNRGKLVLEPLAGRLGGGTFRATANLDASSAKMATVVVEAEAENVELGQIFAQIGEPDLVTGAPADLALRLSGQGTSVAGLASTLDGRILLTIGQGTINDALVDWAGADVLVRLGEALDPQAGGDGNAHLTCGVVNLRASGGRFTWDRQVAFETERMNVVSSGEVDLGRESVDIAVRPYPREGVGLSVGRLAELVRIQGTLAQPELGLDAVGAVGTAASVIGALATGGTSLLAEALVDRQMRDETPCQTALSDRQSKPQPGQQAPVSSQPPSPAKLLEDIGKGIGNLFGN